MHSYDIAIVILGFMLAGGLFFPASPAHAAELSPDGEWTVYGLDAVMTIDGEKGVRRFDDGGTDNWKISRLEANLWRGELIDDSLTYSLTLKLMGSDVLRMIVNGFHAYGIRKGTAAPGERIRGRWVFAPSQGVEGGYDFDRNVMVGVDGRERMPFKQERNDSGLLVTRGGLSLLSSLCAYFRGLSGFLDGSGKPAGRTAGRTPSSRRPDRAVVAFWQPHSERACERTSAMTHLRKCVSPGRRHFPSLGKNLMNLPISIPARKRPRGWPLLGRKGPSTAASPAGGRDETRASTNADVIKSCTASGAGYVSGHTTTSFATSVLRL